MFESFKKAAWEGKDCYCSQGVGAGSKTGGWLEESIATIAGIDPCCICFAATKADGTVFTGYYNADAVDKAVFAHNIQSDIVMDIIKANADTISGILEDGK